MSVRESIENRTTEAKSKCFIGLSFAGDFPVARVDNVVHCKRLPLRAPAPSVTAGGVFAYNVLYAVIGFHYKRAIIR